MFGLGWFWTIVLIVVLFFTAPIWFAILYLLCKLVFFLLEEICVGVFEISAEIVRSCHESPKTASTVAGAVILGVILALAYFFS